MLEVSFHLVFVFIKSLCWGPWHTFLQRMGRCCLFTVEFGPPTDGHQESLHQAWALPFRPHREARESPGLQALPRSPGVGLIPLPCSGDSHQEIPAPSPGPSGQPSPQCLPLHFWIPMMGMQGRYRLQHKLKNIHSILPWSWQEAGWEYAMERRKQPCQILQFPKSRRDLVGAPELTAYQAARRDGSVCEACPLRKAWDNSWVWVPLACPIRAVSSSF